MIQSRSPKLESTSAQLFAFSGIFIVFVGYVTANENLMNSGESVAEPLEISLTGARLRTKSNLSPGGKLGPAANPPAAGSEEAVAALNQISHGPKPSPRVVLLDRSQKYVDSGQRQPTMLKMSAAYVEAPSYKQSASAFREEVTPGRRKPSLQNRRPPNSSRNVKIRPELRTRRLNPTEVGKLVIAFKDMADRINSYQRRAAASARIRTSNRTLNTAQLASSSTTMETARNDLLQIVRKSSIHNQVYQRQLFINGMTVQDVLPLLLSILETKNTPPTDQHLQTDSAQGEPAMGAPFEPDTGDLFVQVNQTFSDGEKNVTKDSTTIVISQDTSKKSRPFGSFNSPAESTTLPTMMSDPPVIVTFADNSPSIPLTSSDFKHASSPPRPTDDSSRLRPSSFLSPVLSWGSMLDQSFFRTVSMEMLNSMMMNFEFQPEFQQ